MIEESARARFERVRRERENRDRTVRLRKRLVNRTDFSDPASRDAGISAGLGSENRGRVRNY